ncbi:hypothetical protein Cgig2_020210 [Carnegiea gigantea]|uniref:Tryptophan/tyrosine permease n=1 Tax=Carnegiea gigantea TaxID=171969 RepID=A0A9Q1KX92_9CARY|nr:hypothetical protein Cgig2_020210 [Carnegiea gigantea]
MVLASSLLSLGTPLLNPRRPSVISHPRRDHHVKPLNLFQFGQFSGTHLPNQLRNCRPRCLSQSQSQSQPTKKLTQDVEEEEQEDEEEDEVKTQQAQVQKYESERLFSNLNQATLKREPGSLSSSIFLVAGTTVGAGILAIPAVTQASGFLASAVACIGCWIFMVVTGLLIAEVNVNTMCELGSGGVSLVVLHPLTNFRIVNTLNERLRIKCPLPFFPSLWKINAMCY